jgi:FkbM family methyltransferase
MCAKFNQVLYKILPDGPVKEAFKSSYYRFYFNKRHFKENEFYVFYSNGHFEYKFDNGVEFSSYEDLTDELKRSLKGYLEKHSLRPGETVVDCGSYIGEFTLYAAKAVGQSGRVIAFEPDPAIFRKLMANIELNGFKNITALNKGLWSKPGTLKFVGDSIKGYSFMSADKDAGAIDVPVVSLDDELERLNIKRVDFIKMDVEGAELEAIKGSARTLKAESVELAIASYHIVDGAKSCFALEKMLQELGYKAETAHSKHLTTYARKNGGGK